MQNKEKIDKLRYPIGRFEHTGPVSPDQIADWITEIDSFPGLLRQQVSELSMAQLNQRYRPGGWTGLQVIHHLADSHMNSYVRFKWALTEERPTIKAYFEDRWALLPDYEIVPAETSLSFIEHLHARWVALLRSLNGADFEKCFVHPADGEVKLEWNVGNYAWHGRHHLAHLQILRY